MIEIITTAVYTATEWVGVDYGIAAIAVIFGAIKMIFGRYE